MEHRHLRRACPDPSSNTQFHREWEDLLARHASLTFLSLSLVLCNTGRILLVDSGWLSWRCGLVVQIRQWIQKSIFDNRILNPLFADKNYLGRSGNLIVSKQLSDCTQIVNDMIPKLGWGIGPKLTFRVGCF